MSGKILYIAPNHFDFYKVIEKGLQQYSNLTVETFVYDNYKYKNIIEKIKNFFMKTFLKKNLKKIKNDYLFDEILQKHKRFEYIIVNRPDLLKLEQLKAISSIGKNTIAIYWDSFEKIKGQKETIPFFDICYSFDESDCENFGLLKNNNFYFRKTTYKTPEYDVFYLGSFDKRFEKLITILDYLNTKNLISHAMLFSKNKKLNSENKNKSISFFDKIIPFPESYIYNENTKIILDIQHENQIGLSFRPFEALGLKKKLITSNQNIKSYDFYDSNNIFVWSDLNQEIPDSFFKTPYIDVSKEIYEKYYIKNWVQNILKAKVNEN